MVSKEKILEILVDWQQTLTPEFFEESLELSPEFFVDAPFGTAQELGLEKEFIEALTNAKFRF